VVVTPECFQDDRGFFFEVYRQDVFREAGLPATFVQLNHSRSVKHTVRGLHFQWDPPMGKLMRVTRGTAFLVAVDLRTGSPTLGAWYGSEVNADSRRQIWAPAGFGRGFCALSDVVDIEYLCTGTYNSAGEGAVLWNDPAVGIKWPVEAPILSNKDRNAQTLGAWLQKAESSNLQW
jgi:dTDP-4-dehydrorhamnose 3,5-epimerase